MMASGESIEVITTIADLDALAASWPQGGHVFEPLLSHDWFSAAARAFCAPGSLHVIAYRRNGSLAAVAPLHRTTRFGIGWLEIIGSAELYEPSGLPAVDAAALRALCSAIVTQGRPTMLQRLDRSDACIESLRQAARSVGRISCITKPSTYYVPADLSWAQIDAAMSVKRRKRLRKLRNELRSQGEVVLEELTPGPEAVPALLERVMQVEAAGWKGQGGSALLNKESLRSFFAELALKLAGRRELRLFLLHVGGRTIAVQMGIECDQRFWALKRGYDERWAKYTPGLLLNSDAIAYMLDERRTGWEFLGLCETWEEQWSPRTRDLCAVAYFPRNARGYTALTGEVLIDAARSAARRLRARKRPVNSDTGNGT